MTVQITTNISILTANKTSKTNQGISKSHQSTVDTGKVIPQHMKVSKFQKMCPNP